jgi:hypothetical protein
MLQYTVLVFRNLLVSNSFSVQDLYFNKRTTLTIYQLLCLHGLRTFAIKNKSFEKVKYSFHVLPVPL